MWCRQPIPVSWPAFFLFLTSTTLSVRAFTVTGFDCDFETLCGWTQWTGDQLDWDHASGPTSANGTGPSGDHTTGQGQFLYLEASGGTEGQIAILGSPPVDVTSATSCVTFWYHMRGADTGSLVVQRFPAGSGASPVIAWSQTGHKDDAWTKAQITFDTASPARVVFIAVSGAGDTSNEVAIDDVSIAEGICEADGEWAPWGSCSVTCGGGQRVRCLVCDTTPSGGQSSTCDGSYKETEDCGTQACGTTSDTDEVGIIAGAVVGCLLIVAVTTIVIVWIMRKKSFGSSKRSDSSTELGQMSTRSISYMGYENPDDIRTQGLSTSGRAGVVTVPAQIGADYDDVNQTEGRDVDTSDYDKLEMYENKKEITNVYTSLDHGEDRA